MIERTSTPHRSLNLVARVLILVILAVTATGAVSTFLAVTSMRGLSLSIVETLYGRFLDGASRNLETAVVLTYGTIENKGNTLVGDGGLDISRTSQVVDVASMESSVAATIYVLGSGGFTSIQTSLRNKDAKRAIGETIALDSQPGKALAAGDEYHGTVMAGGELHMAMMTPLVDDAGKTIGAIFVGQSLSALDELLSDSMRAAFMKILLGTAAMIALSGLLVCLRLRSSISPLRRTVAALAEISAEGGDLTLRIEARRNDETGHLATHFNTFIERLRREFANVKAEAAALKDKAEELERGAAATSSSIERIDLDIEKVRSKVAEQSSAVAESTSAVGQISANIEALDRRIAEEAGTIEESSLSISAMAEDIASTAAMVGDLVESVARLKTASQEGNEAIEAAREQVAATAAESDKVLELNDLIGSVADRTRILAMNAAIEAAHAGDYGRGFAVVADEIRKLADEAADRAAETAFGLKGIMEATGRLTEASDLVGSSFARIDESVAHTDSALATIAERMTAQRAGAGRAIDRLQAVRDSTHAITQGSAEMRQGSGLVIKEMQRLLSLSAEIEDVVGRIALEVIAIEEEAEKTVEAAAANAHSAAGLDAELAPYKT